MSVNDSSNQSDHAIVMRAAGLLSVAVLLSRMLGLVREIVTRNYIGATGMEANAYAVANRFPEAIFFVIAGGAIGSAFIPTFAAYFARDDEAGGWRLFSAVINLMTVVVTTVAVITAVFAPQFVQFFYGGQIANEPELLPLTVKLMRIMLVSPIIFGVSGVMMGALNARQHFLLPALAPSIYNLGIIAGAILIRPPEVGLAVGAVVGALGHLLIQLPGLRQKGAKYTAVITLTDPGVRQVLRLMAPRVLGLSFSQINNFIILLLTGSAMLVTGSLPALDVAFRLIIMPQGFLGQALGIAAFPTLSTLAAKQAFDDMRDIIVDSLRILLFVGIPITLVLAVLRTPIVTLIFERGEFGAVSTQFAAWALLFYAFGLIALAGLEIVARSFYALGDTLTPVLAGGVQIVLMGIFSYWLSFHLFPALGWLPLGGLALGFSLSNILEALLLLWLLRRKMGRLDGRRLLNGLIKMSAAGSAMLLAMWGVGRVTAVWPLFIQLVMVSLLGGIVYILSSHLLRIEELNQIVAYGRRRLRR